MNGKKILKIISISLLVILLMVGLSNCGFSQTHSSSQRYRHHKNAIHAEQIIDDKDPASPKKHSFKNIFNFKGHKTHKNSKSHGSHRSHRTHRSHRSHRSHR